MLRLRLSVNADDAADVAAALSRTGAVSRLTSARDEAAPAEVVLMADVAPAFADEVIAVIEGLGAAPADYVLVRQDVVAPSPVGHTRHGATGALAWVELVGDARANARPIARYLALMSVAAVVAASGVLTDNAILIVGAMAVSPDLLPICATCVGLVARRWRLARRSLLTLVIGLGLVVVVAAAVTALLNVTGILEDGFILKEQGLGGLATTDYSTVLVALAAGVAGILSFETRASAAVGVAISVTTIPASAYLGVACGLGQLSSADGALAVLGLNVTLLILSGTVTLAFQDARAKRKPPPAEPAGSW